MSFRNIVGDGNNGLPHLRIQTEKTSSPSPGFWDLVLHVDRCLLWQPTRGLIVWPLHLRSWQFLQLTFRSGRVHWRLTYLRHPAVVWGYRFYVAFLISLKKRWVVWRYPLGFLEVDYLIFVFLGQPFGMGRYRMGFVRQPFDTAKKKSRKNPIDGRKRNTRFLMNNLGRLLPI